MDYPDQDFTELKHTDAKLLLIQRDQFHLDLHTNFASTWLCPKIFHHWIKNSDSLAPKYSELLASHRDNLRSEGYLYLYLSQATLDSKVLSNWLCSVRYTPTSYLYTILLSPHSLVKRTTNIYGAQRPILDIAIALIIVYHLVMNLRFKD